MRALLAATIFVTGCALAIGDEAQLTEGKLPDPVEGGYTVTSGERDGKPIPSEELTEAMVRITRGEMFGTYKDLRYFLADSYTLNTSKTPWQIKLTNVVPPGARNKSIWQKATVNGLIKRQGGVVTLIYALPGGPTPTEFKTKPGQQMFILESFATGKQPPNKFPKE